MNYQKHPEVLVVLVARGIHKMDNYKFDNYSFTFKKGVMFSKSNSFILYYLSHFFPKEVCFHIYNLKKDYEIDDAKHFYIGNTNIKMIKRCSYDLTYDLIEDNKQLMYIRNKMIFINKDSNKITINNHKYLHNLFYNTNYNYNNNNYNNINISKIILNEINYRNRMLHYIRFSPHCVT